MVFVIIGAIFAFLSVLLGAFAAHGLRRKIPAESLTVFQTGAQYQMYHAFALIATGIMIILGHTAQGMQIAGWLFVAGIVLFSGSLYLLAVTGKKLLGAITPFGGLCFLAGWALFVIVLVS